MFTVAGVSCFNGKWKVRFCSDKVLRIKNLQKQNETQINLIDLPKSMSKVEACEYLLSLPSFAPFTAEIEEVLNRHTSGKGKTSIKLPKAKVEEVDVEIEKIQEYLTSVELDAA